MGTTPNLKLPIPELTDVLDGPDAFSDLANATENYVYNRNLPAGVTRMPSYYWGAGTTFPNSVALRPGDTYQHLGLGSALMSWTGTTWRQTEPVEVANATTRTAMSLNYSTLLHPGFRVYQTDASLWWEWDATSNWVLTDVRAKAQLSLYHANGVPQHATLTTVTGWTSVSAAPAGLISFDNSSGVVTFNAKGRVRIDALAYSDTGNGIGGFSHFIVDMPDASRNYLGTLENLSHRSSGAYGGNGFLRQGVGGGPFEVNPGDTTRVKIFYANPNGTLVTYLYWLNVTYV